MKALILSRYGDGLDYAIDGKRDGHEVVCWIQDPKRRHEIFDGMVKKVDDFKTVLPWADFVLCDANHLEKEWAVCAKAGKPIWNGSPEGNELESNRDLGRKVFEDAGMKHLGSDTYKTIEEAIKAIQGKKLLRVAKVFGGDSDSEDVVISEMEDGTDLIAVLQRYADSGKKYDGVEVEERVTGPEIGCARYYSKGVPTGPIEISFQHKEPAAGWPGGDRGLGALCGESGTVCIYVPDTNAFYKKTLALCEDYFREIKLTGEVDLGCMVDEDDGQIYGLEWTSGRPGYPDSMMRRSMCDGKQLDFFASCAAGKPIDFKGLPGWGICFLLMAPGFPYAEAVEKHSAGYPVIGYDEANTGLHLQEVKKGKRGIEVAKGCGYAAVVSARGPSIESARRRARWLVSEGNPKRFFVPKMAIRTDIGDRVIAQREQILDFGLMTKAEWGGAA